MHFVNVKKLTKGLDDYGEIPSERTLIKTTLRMAWPSVVESLSVNLANFIDTIMIGTLGAPAIAAIGLTNQPKFIAWAIFFALNVAVSSIVARRKGEGNRDSANRVLRMSLVIVFILSIVIAAVFFVFASPIIKFIGSQPDTHEMAVEYFQIIMLGTLFQAAQMIINGAQRGAGNTRIAMVTNITSNAVNVIFNYLLIGGNLGFPALGVKGAAIATVIGMFCAFVLSVLSIFRRDSFIDIRATKGWIADKLSRASMMKVGSSAFVEQICLRVGFVLFQMTVARLGTYELAAHQIGMNMMSMSFSIGDGLSVASVALIGRSLGEKRPDMAKIYGSVCQRIGLICACVISLIYTFFGRQLFSLFTSDEYVLSFSRMIMIIISIMLFFQIEQVVQFGCLRGAGDTRFTALLALVSVTIIRPGASFLLCYPAGLGLMGAWLGTSIDQIVRFTVSNIRFRRGNWIKIKL